MQPAPILLFPGRRGIKVGYSSVSFPAPLSPHVGKHATVLLVDSHEDSRLIYAAALRHHGLEVQVAESAQRALALARSKRPGVVVLELPPAAPFAWASIETLRGRHAPHVPVLGLSTTGLREHRERALRLGCAEFLVKPLGPVELLAHVRRFLNG